MGSSGLVWSAEQSMRGGDRGRGDKKVWGESSAGLDYPERSSSNKSMIRPPYPGAPPSRNPRLGANPEIHPTRTVPEPREFVVRRRVVVVVAG